MSIGEFIERGFRYAVGVAIVVGLLSLLPGSIVPNHPGPASEIEKTLFFALFGLIAVVSVTGSLFIPRGETLAIWCAGAVGGFLLFLLMLSRNCGDSVGTAVEPCLAGQLLYGLGPMWAIVALVPRMLWIFVHKLTGSARDRIVINLAYRKMRRDNVASRAKEKR